MPAPRNVVILGSTGSIGRQALEVIEARPDLEVVGLSAGSDEVALAEQADRLGTVERALGEEGSVELARHPDADIVLNAIVGSVGLRASIAALGSGKTLALANKESLVAGGEVCLDAARRGGGRIVPVDSEHAALAHCLEGRDPRSVARLILTASGGPFRKKADLTAVTVDDALAHPTWSMGPKITIDSATMMNKGLEIIEAHFLFAFDYDRIDVVIHPQSLVHGGIELIDGGLILHAAPTDMKIPIQSALTSPDHVAFDDRIDLADAGQLTFEHPDHERFPAVRLAYEAGRRGGTYPAAMNAANEVAVHAFLAGRIAFTDIVGISADVIMHHESLDAHVLDNVLEADRAARAEATELVDDLARVGTTS